MNQYNNPAGIVLDRGGKTQLRQLNIAAANSNTPSFSFGGAAKGYIYTNRHATDTIELRESAGDATTVIHYLAAQESKFIASENPLGIAVPGANAVDVNILALYMPV